MKVFLGGTCNESIWRDIVIQGLKIDYYNPVVPDWTPECQKEEAKQRIECDLILYVITPKMTGVFSIAECVDDSNKRPNDTFFCYLTQDEQNSFNESQLRSLHAVGKLVKSNGATWCHGLDDCIQSLNHRARERDILYKTYVQWRG